MPKQDAFTRAYIEAALWSSMDNTDDQGGDPLDKNYGPGDIAPATMAAMERDCADFQEKYGDLILDDESAAIDKWGRWELAGHDFWLTRNGHGAGFGDGNFPKHDDELAEAAQAYGDFELYVGDDGVIYAFGHEEEAGAVGERRLGHAAREAVQLPHLVTGALSASAECVHAGEDRGIRFEVYYDPSPPREAKGRRHDHNYAAVVYTPYESERGGGVEAEQIGFGFNQVEAIGVAKHYIARLTRPEPTSRRRN